MRPAVTAARPTPRSTSRARGGRTRRDGDLARRFTDPSISDADWPEVVGPGPLAQHRGVRRRATGRCCTGGRSTAAPLEPGHRRFLTFDGIFYHGDVWLDGGYLGATEGYFFPHTFEVTEQARSAPDDGHLLAVEVACPPQTRPHREADDHRRVLALGQPRPGLEPRRHLAAGPAARHRAGAHQVAARAVHARRPRRAAGSCSTSRSTPARTRDPCRSGAPLRHRHRPRRHDARRDDQRRDARRRATTRSAVTVEVDHPPRWWPWRLGDAAAVRRRGAGRGRRACRATTAGSRTAFREIRVKRLAADGQRRAHVPDGLEPRPDPHGARRGDAPRSCSATSQLAVDANLDLLRIHAHVTRLELYDAADAAGLLLWQDLPLQWGYARGTRKQAVRQAREMVDLLGHHPSIALWCAHNEPLAIDLQPGEPIRARDVGARPRRSMFLPSWNKDVLDRSVTPRVAQGRPDPRRSTRTRACCPGVGSGGTDTHLYFGWYHGGWTASRRRCARCPRLARFVTEFGAQAVPDTADFMEPRALARPRLGRPVRAPRVPEAATSTSTCRPRCSTRSRRGATRPSTTRPR